MPQRVGAVIAIGWRIRRAADTKGIENKQKSPRHASPIMPCRILRFTMHRFGIQMKSGRIRQLTINRTD
ncbi:hypothetical protein RvVAR0630_01740 [Agrobacterium vitis]|nr:hypothetical protein RvVAR0630_01740 [Agrobacterium vitis]